MPSNRFGDGVRETNGSGDIDRVGDDRFRHTRFDAGASDVEETGDNRFCWGGIFFQDAVTSDLE